MKALIVVFLLVFFTACQKQWVSTQGLNGNWVSVEGDDVVKLSIENNGKIKISTPTDRGFKFRAERSYIDYNYYPPSSVWKHVVFEKADQHYLKINMKANYDTIFVVSYNTINESYCCGTGLKMVRDEN